MAVRKQATTGTTGQVVLVVDGQAVDNSTQIKA